MIADVRDSHFEWDDAKALRNARKHGVTFAEACQVFSDSQAVEFEDTRQDYGEERWIRVGRAGRHLLVVAVAYTERGLLLRIISAMPAPAPLRQLYEEGM